MCARLLVRPAGEVGGLEVPSSVAMNVLFAGVVEETKGASTWHAPIAKPSKRWGPLRRR
jgi:hypothetical protein